MWAELELRLSITLALGIYLVCQGSIPKEWIKIMMQLLQMLAHSPKIMY